MHEGGLRMPDRTTIARRAVLKAAPAAAAAVALPAVAAELESEIMRLFAIWIGERTELDSDPEDWPAERLDAACERLRELEAAMNAIPSRTAREVAAKVLADTANDPL